MYEIFPLRGIEFGDAEFFVIILTIVDWYRWYSRNSRLHTEYGGPLILSFIIL
jgi:hypothetical protein